MHNRNSVVSVDRLTRGDGSCRWNGVLKFFFYLFDSAEAMAIRWCVSAIPFSKLSIPRGVFSAQSTPSVSSSSDSCEVLAPHHPLTALPGHPNYHKHPPGHWGA